MSDAHILHRHWWLIVLDHFVVVSSNQPVEGVANKGEAEMAKPVSAGTAKRD